MCFEARHREPQEKHPVRLVFNGYDCDPHDLKFYVAISKARDEHRAIDRSVQKRPVDAKASLGVLAKCHDFLTIDDRQSHKCSSLDFAASCVFIFLQFFNTCRDARVLGIIVTVELAHEPLEHIHTVHVRSRDADLLCSSLDYDGRDISLIELQKIFA